MKTDVAGVLIDNLNKSSVLEQIKKRIDSSVPGYIVTPYSELILFAMRNEQYKSVLNQAFLSLPDGIGVLWAAKFLSLEATSFIQVRYQALKTLLAILVNPKYVRSVIPEKITGSRIVYDIASLARSNNYSLALVGGEDAVAFKAAQKLIELNPGLKINLCLSDCPFDDNAVEKIAASNSDILLIAYSPPKQEQWLSQNLLKLNVKVGIGLGGTFDYLALKRYPAPQFLHYIGLEWFWRLVTQPYRIKRMWNAVPVFIWEVVKFKIKKTYVRN